MSRRRRRHHHRDEHPRHRLLHHGTPSLSDAELVEILLRNGWPGSTAKEIVRELLVEYGGLVGLGNVDPAYLRRHGIGEAKAATVVEIGTDLQLPAVSSSLMAAVRSAGKDSVSRRDREFDSATGCWRRLARRAIGSRGKMDLGWLGANGQGAQSEARLDLVRCAEATELCCGLGGLRSGVREDLPGDNKLRGIGLLRKL